MSENETLAIPKGFIRLTRHDDGRGVILVRYAHIFTIDSFRTPADPKPDGSSICLSGRSTIYVQVRETPDEIAKILAELEG